MAADRLREQSPLVQIAPEPARSQFRVTGHAQPRVRFHHLQTFLAIVECGTLTAAAEQIFKTQGAVSQDLKALEATLAVRLIDRDGQRIQLTEAGRTLLPHARELLGRLCLAEAEIERMRTGRHAVIRLGMLPSLARPLAPLVANLQALSPETRTLLFTGSSEELASSVAAGTLDIAVCETDAQDGLLATALYEEDFCVALLADNPLADRPVLSAKQLRDVPFIGFNRAIETPRIAQRFFASIYRYPEPAVEATDVWTIIEFVRAGVGYGLLPRSVLDVPDLIAVPTDPPLTREVAVITNGSTIPTSVVTHIYELIVGTWRCRTTPLPRRAEGV
jgi:DNA-binding transcriptional LysR family regulator